MKIILHRFAHNEYVMVNISVLNGESRLANITLDKLEYEKT